MSKTFKFAFVKTIPVMLGYLFLGLAFGLLLQEAGYSFWWALLISTVVYAGSIQFVLVSFLTAGTSLPVVAVMTLLINSRHAFYGLTFIEKFKVMKSRPYMIFSLTDETYSLLCSLKVPEEIDEKKVMFLISLLDQLYWIVGSVAGAALGQVLPFDMTGIDFAMTALFVTIFVDQWERSEEPSARSHRFDQLSDLSSDLRRQQFYPAVSHHYSDNSDGIAKKTGRKGGKYMTATRAFVIILVTAVCTLITRLVPFTLFGGKKEMPKAVNYLGVILPPAIMTTLVVYCLKGADLFSTTHGIPELSATILTALLHAWKRNVLLSIAAGTFCYMLLVQVVF